MIKAIVFDCFGVLTTDLWKEFTASLPDKQRLAARDINHAYDGGFITHAEFTAQIEQLTGKTPGEVEAVRNSDGLKNEQLLGYIAELKPHYKIGLLSNIATNWIREDLLNVQEQALFNDIILSFEVGMTKPDPKIFELSAKRLGVSPETVVFVDDINHYCEAARTVGMSAIVYHDFAQMKRELETILGGG